MMKRPPLTVNSRHAPTKSHSTAYMMDVDEDSWMKQSSRRDNSDNNNSPNGSSGTDDDTVWHPPLEQQEQQEPAGYSENLEERQMMRELSVGIGQTEENKLMQDLLDDIRAAEDAEFFKKQPSMVRQIWRPDASSDDDDINDMGEPEPWAVQQLRSRRRATPTATGTSSSSKVWSIDEVRFVQIALPKRIPAREKGTYDAKDRRVLFTREQFQTYVLDEVVRSVPEDMVVAAATASSSRSHGGSRLSFAARISEHHPTNPDAYLLEARGNEDALRMLHAQTELFLRWMIRRKNQAYLLEEDDASLLVDVSIDAHSSHGIQFWEFPDNDFSGGSDQSEAYKMVLGPDVGGVWVKRLTSKKSVARALGSSQRRDTAIVVVAIDGIQVNSKGEFDRVVQHARQMGHETKMLVTLCLSKTADLENAPDTSALNIRYTSGTPYDPLDQKIDRLVAEMRQQLETTNTNAPGEHEPCWVEYPTEESYRPAELPEKRPKTSKAITKAFWKVMNRTRSVEIDVNIPPTSELGASVQEIPGENGKDGGVYLHNIRLKGPIGQVLGEKAIRYGCVLWKMSGVAVKTWGDVKSAAEMADTGRFQDRLRVTLVSFDGTDLSGISRDQLIRDRGRVNPRRRNGEAYPLHLEPQSQCRHLEPSDDDESLDFSEPKPIKKKKRRQESDLPVHKEKNPSKKPRTQRNILLDDADSDDSDDDRDMLTAKKRSLHHDVSDSAKKEGRLSRSFADQEISDSEAVASRPKVLSASQVSGLGRYRQFENKYKELVDLDYKDTKVHAKQRVASLWSQHKKIFGDAATCGEMCPCIFHLKDMASTVLKDFIEKQNKEGKTVDSEETLEALTCGIFERFGPIFIPKLKREYPNETSNKLLQRLVDMWRLHFLDRRLSTHCREGCECGGEWDQLFGKGDKSQAQAFKLQSSSRATATSTRTSSLPLIPKKKALPLQPRRSTMGVANPRDAVVQRRPPSEFPFGGTRRRVAPVARLSYELSFDPSKPLGVYFRTEPSQNGLRKCRVVSTYLNGQFGVDSRIMTGTSVASYMQGEKAWQISTHEELRGFYESARNRRQLKFRLVFDNTGAKGHSNEDWDASGNWIGMIKDGWDGSSEAGAGPGVNASVSQAEQWTTVVNDEQVPPPTAEPKKSILVSSASSQNGRQEPKKTAKKIVFAADDSIQQVYSFYDDRPVNEQVVKLTPSSNVASLETPLTPRRALRKALVDAVQLKTVKEMIEVLADGPSDEWAVVEPVLKEAKDWVKDKLYAPGSDDNINKPDLEAKLAVLRIHLDAAFAIAMATRLTKWNVVEVEVRQIELKGKGGSLSHQGKLINGRVYLRVINDSDRKEQLGRPLDVRPQAEYIGYEAGEYVYKTHNNISLALEKRELWVDLKRVPAEALGSAIFDVDDIEEQCQVDGSWVELSRPLAVTNFGLLSSGSLSIVARKQSAGDDYILTKKEDARTRLRLVIGYIQRFNEDPNTPKGARMTGNVQGRDGYSLLHAAVSLTDDPGLIDSLLALGADPKLKSSSGETPLKMATNLLDKASENPLEARIANNNYSSLSVLVEDRLRMEKQKKKETMCKTNLEKLKNYCRQVEFGQFGNEESLLQPPSSNVETTINRHFRNEIRVDRTDIQVPSHNGIRQSDQTHAFIQGAECNRNGVRSARPTGNVPRLLQSDWAEVPGSTRCWQRDKCRFYGRAGGCRYWHVKRSFPTPDSATPRTELSKRDVMWKTEGGWWTCVFQDHGNKTTIYPHGGSHATVSDDGVDWYATREDALEALERAVSSIRSGTNQPSARRGSWRSGGGDYGSRGGPSSGLSRYGPAAGR